MIDDKIAKIYYKAKHFYMIFYKNTFFNLFIIKIKFQFNIS